MSCLYQLANKARIRRDRVHPCPKARARRGRSDRGEPCPYDLSPRQKFCAVFFDLREALWVGADRGFRGISQRTLVRKPLSLREISPLLRREMPGTDFLSGREIVGTGFTPVRTASPPTRFRTGMNPVPTDSFFVRKLVLSIRWMLPLFLVWFSASKDRVGL